jgi:hypothetical protein
MPLRTWRQYRFYDVTNDCDAVRISGFSGHGEYWVARPVAQGGKSRRQQLDEALDQIEAAIDAEAQPGEVTDEGTRAALVRKRERERQQAMAR